MQTAHVIGAGGIGVTLGWALARAGWAVTMVESNPAKVAAGRQDGLCVDGITETRPAWIPFDEWTPPTGAALLLCTKTYDNAAVLERLPSREWLVPVQNGFDPALDASGHPIEGIASFVSQCERDRPMTRITRPGELFVGGRGPLVGYSAERVNALAGALRAGGLRQVETVESIAPYKSSKLMYNAAISPLAAAAGIDNGELLSDPLAQRLFFALLRENYGILCQRGIRLARIGPFHPWLVNRILSLPGLAKMLAHLFRPGLRGTYCSMAPDMETGRTEIAAYNGYLKRIAGSIACPINSAVLEMMKSMMELGLRPDRQRLVELGSAVGLGGVV